MKYVWAGVLVLAGCGGSGPETPSADPIAPEKLAGCKAEALAASVGQPLSSFNAVLPENTRVLEPGSVATQEYNPARTNVHVSGDGTILQVYCG
ncbi:MAG: I78 family peptidase inhibitor [Pseudomonadota bacterium]